jgi:hypothetical protein
MQKKILFVFLLIFVLTIATVFSVYGYPDEGQNGTTLTETVSATPTWRIEYTWALSKSVMPNTWDLFMGDSGKSAYKLSVTKSAGVEQAYISGDICVTNAGGEDTVDLEIIAVVQDGYAPPNDFLTSAPVNVSTHPILSAGETYCYTYKVNIPITDGAFPQPHAGGTYKITGQTTILNHSGSLGQPFGPNKSTTVVFPSTPLMINEHVWIHDTFLKDPVNAYGTTDINYDHTFTCDDDEGKKENSAYIEYEDKSTSIPVSASVMVTCNSLEVTKTALTSFDRTYKWTINKTSDQTDVTLDLGKTMVVKYKIIVDVVAQDSNWAVAGKITIHNPADIPAIINSVADLVSPDIAVTIDCGKDLTFPYSLAAGSDLNCNYSTALPDGTERTNTAMAALQNFAYNQWLEPTDSGMTEFPGSTEVTFGQPKNVSDRCVQVKDDKGGDFGQICAGTDTPFEKTYSLTIGPYNICGNYKFENIASLFTIPAGKDDIALLISDDTWSVNVNVPCSGCTLTQGYWKTHSKYGPAPYDDAWALVPDADGKLTGEDTVFFKSDLSWYEVLWTAPKKGNAYYILAHQYIAAVLNQLNGSDTTQVKDLIQEATGLFNKYGPDDFPSDVRSRFIEIASILDQFNNGMLGPGHCGDEPGYTGPTPSWVYNMYKGNPVIFIPVVIH